MLNVILLTAAAVIYRAHLAIRIPDRFMHANEAINTIIWFGQAFAASYLVILALKK